MGMFGFKSPFGTPSIAPDQDADLTRPQGMGMFGAGVRTAPVQPSAMAGFTPYKTGFFDKAGMVGDILRDDPSTFGEQLVAQKQGQAALAYQAAHPAPLVVGGKAFDPRTFAVLADGSADHTDSVTGHVAALNAIKPGLGDTYAQNFASNGGSTLPQITTIPGVGTFAMPRTGAPASAPPAASAAIPDEAVARLRSNPHEAAKFDEIFGAGASARYLTGGAAPQASAPFQTP